MRGEELRAMALQAGFVLWPNSADGMFEITRDAWDRLAAALTHVRIVEKGPRSFYVSDAMARAVKAASSEADEAKLNFKTYKTMREMFDEFKSKSELASCIAAINSKVPVGVRYDHDKQCYVRLDGASVKFHELTQEGDAPAKPLPEPCPHERLDDEGAPPRRYEGDDVPKVGYSVEDHEAREAERKATAKRIAAVMGWKD